MASLDLSKLTTSQAIAKLRGLFPQATNAQALAVLSGIQQWTDASNAIAAGVPKAYAESFMGPDGILPRMRLLACGWTNPGDSFKPPGDDFWQTPYKYPLWNPLATYAAMLDRVRGVSGGIVWDADLADGDAGALTHETTAVVDELAPVMEAPCPRWVIPPGPGQMPVANPDCARRELDKNKDKIPLPLQPASSDSSWLWLLLIAGWYLTRKKR